MRAVVLALAALVACPAQAEFAPLFPGPATPTASRTEPMASYRLPVGAWRPEGLPVAVLEGALRQSAWQLPEIRLSTLEVLMALRGQLQGAGWTVLFECDTDACGGFDFRYETELLPEPEMHVDLSDFRYLAARLGEGGAARHLGLIVSRSPQAGFVHLTEIGPATASDLPLQPAMAPMTAPQQPGDPILPQPTTASGEIGAQLLARGAVALDDLAFESGAAVLAQGDYASLAALAGWLAANPGQRIALVGHTDATGGLAANIALSKRRADAVRARLVNGHGIAAGQLEAEGAGWLAPRAPNLTPEGRALNRRVEAVLLTAESDRP